MQLSGAATAGGVEEPHGYVVCEVALAQEVEAGLGPRAREEFLQGAASHAGTVVERASEEPIRDAGDEGTEFALWQAQAPLRFEVAVKPSEQIESRPV